MDLRPHIKTRQQLEQGVALIRRGLLFYQPFILADEIEVGEGMNFCNRYEGVETVFDLNAYAKGVDIGKRKQPPELTWFRQCNHEYRLIYQYICDVIAQNAGERIQDLSFCEIGCNTGLTLFLLAMRGARSCHGLDWNDMQAVFAWLNDVLGTNVLFSRGIYSNLYHRFENTEVEPVDVMINTVFLNHQCDPLQFLCYLCDRAKTGVFLWILIEGSDEEDCFIRFPPAPPHKLLATGNPFPLYFNNDVRLSDRLLRVTLAQLGFEDVRAIDKFVPSEKWQGFQSGFRMYYARRTNSAKSAYWTTRSRMGDSWWQYVRRFVRRL